LRSGDPDVIDVDNDDNNEPPLAQMPPQPETAVSSTLGSERQLSSHYLLTDEDTEAALLLRHRHKGGGGGGSEHGPAPPAEGATNDNIVTTTKNKHNAEFARILQDSRMQTQYSVTGSFETTTTNPGGENYREVTRTEKNPSWITSPNSFHFPNPFEVIQF
jgi:hypothetical protein